MKVHSPSYQCWWSLASVLLVIYFLVCMRKKTSNKLESGLDSKPKSRHAIEEEMVESSHPHHRMLQRSKYGRQGMQPSLEQCFVPSTKPQQRRKRADRKQQRYQRAIQPSETKTQSSLPALPRHRTFECWHGDGTESGLFQSSSLVDGGSFRYRNIIIDKSQQVIEPVFSTALKANQIALLLWYASYHWSVTYGVES